MPDEFVDLKLGEMDLEAAVYTALGAASVCWEDMSRAGIFESERCANIGEQLMERIQQAGPIYE